MNYWKSYEHQFKIFLFFHFKLSLSQYAEIFLDSPLTSTLAKLLVGFLSCC